MWTTGADTQAVGRGSTAEPAEGPGLSGIYKKLRRGDATTDAERVAFVRAVKPAVGVLRQLGAEYRLVAVELDRLVATSEDALRARRAMRRGVTA